jgi:hypothetical protein
MSDKTIVYKDECDCGDHVKQKKMLIKEDIKSFHVIIKKIDKLLRDNSSIVLISKL